MTASVVTPLDEDAARVILEELAAEGVESLAICLLFSFMNESHERRLAELAAEIMPRRDGLALVQPQS